MIVLTYIIAIIYFNLRFEYLRCFCLVKSWFYTHTSEAINIHVIVVSIWKAHRFSWLHDESDNVGLSNQVIKSTCYQNKLVSQAKERNFWRKITQWKILSLSFRDKSVGNFALCMVYVHVLPKKLSFHSGRPPNNAHQ